MKKSIYFVILFFLAIGVSVRAQIGIKAGINMANEIKSLSSEAIAAGFSTENLTGYEVGLVAQLNSKKSGLGAEIGFLLSQKGFSYSDSVSVVDMVKRGYKELNYIEVPLNLRYCLKLGFVGVYGYGGLYVGYALNGKLVDETEAVSQDIDFGEMLNRSDYGYNLGLGVEFFKKIQFGANWSQGLKKSVFQINQNADPRSNRVYSVTLTYLF